MNTAKYSPDIRKQFKRDQQYVSKAAAEPAMQAQ